LFGAQRDFHAFLFVWQLWANEEKHIEAKINGSTMSILLRFVPQISPLRLLRLMETSEMVPSRYVYHRVLRDLRQSRQLDDSVKLLAEMEAKGIPFNGLTWGEKIHVELSLHHEGKRS